VAAYKKKIVASLMTVALVSSISAASAYGEETTLQKEASTQSATAEQAKPQDNSSSLFRNDPNFSLSSSNSLGTREMFFKMMLSVLLVVALGAAVIYISKKYLPKITNLPGKKIQIIETTHIGPRKMVHLLKIGNQRFLIGSTNENITKLADVTDALSETEAGCEGSRRRFENRNVFKTEMDLSVTETDNN
jgi:flagellar biosynthetic protein FliO